MRRAAVLGLGLAVAVLAIIATPRTAAAEPPPIDHVITAPTAWLPGSGTIVAGGGIDHRGDDSIDVGVGLGGIAAVDLGIDHDVRRCDGCADARPDPIELRRVQFRLGARQDQLFRGQPAVVLGTREVVAGTARAADLYLVASRRLGGLRVHAGVDAIDARSVGEPARLGATIRPMIGAELTVPQYPRTTLMADLAWVPRVDPGAPAVEALGGWGVRYQALRWGAIDLAVRHRGGEGIGDATVLVRVIGVWGR